MSSRVLARRWFVRPGSSSFLELSLESGGLPLSSICIQALLLLPRCALSALLSSKRCFTLRDAAAC